MWIGLTNKDICNRVVLTTEASDSTISGHMQIIPLSIPTPFYVGEVNVYLIKEDPVTLIDVGPKTPEAAAALREKLGENGIRFSDVRRIVLTTRA